jgi:dethiobiotin synthetase
MKTAIIILPPMNYFVTAIGTDSGKTVVSSILCEALGADYWKPVQAGLPRDTETVMQLVTNNRTKFHPEQYLLKTPASPHAAARIDGVNIELASFVLPSTHNTLIIEGAGGCLVPLNDRDFVIDLIQPFQSEVILVSNLYLGSINHTLLTAEALKRRNIKVRGLIFNGDSNEESERIILSHTGFHCLLRIKHEPVMNAQVVKSYAATLNQNWDG